jgi:iron-sulfur cluster repair protein YtfE (RIC family)
MPDGGMRATLRRESTAKEVSMTSRPTETFRQEHAQLLEHIEHIRFAAREAPRLSPVELESVVGRVVEFLRGTLLPHAAAEEQVLYPEWARLVGYPDAAVPMIHDHRAIAARVEQLAATSLEDIDSLQERLYGLHALIVVHFRKEEEIQLPFFDEQPPEVVEQLLERMEAHAGGAHTHA